MRSSLPFLSSTGRAVLGLLCAGALLASCETSPDNFGSNPISSEYPLKKITLDKIDQYVLILPQGGQGVGIPVDSPDYPVEISLKSGEGLYTDGQDGTLIRLHFESAVPVDSDFQQNFERSTGYELESYRMDLEITPSKSGGGPGLQQNQCVTDSANLIVTRRDYWGPGRDTIYLPIEATIDNVVKTVDGDGDPVFEGKLHLFCFYWPNNWEDIFIYDLQADIRIE